MTLELVPAGLDDIGTIMEMERQPGYEKLVGRWDAEQHRAAMANPDYRYFIGLDGGRRVGFVLVKGWDSADHNTLLKRVAVTEPGKGYGSRMVAAAVATIYMETAAHRISIGCFPDNTRARAAYEKAGFTAEGISRGSAYFYGAHHDELVLSILRPEWEARHRL